MIHLETCEILSEIRIDDYYFNVTLSPSNEGSCILWFRDARIHSRFKALGRFSFFDKFKVLQFIARFSTSESLRREIEHRKFQNRLEHMTPLGL